MAAAVRELRFPGRSPELVLGDGESPLLGAVATPLATLVNGPVLLVPNADLDGAVLAEIERRGTVVVKVVGPALPPTIDAALAERGIAVERVGSSPDPASFSAEVAAWVRWVFGDRPYVCVEPGGLSAAAAPLAAAFAASKGWPLVVGAGTAGSGGAAYLVGPEAAARAGELLGPVPVAAPTLLGLSLDLASIARAEGGSPSTVALAPHSSPVTLALAGLGAPIVLHEPHSLDGARPWLHAHQRGAQRAVLAGSSGALPPEAYKELQSILNGFDAHKLIGVAGQGLPVIPQPGPEQPLGRARNGPAPPLPPAAPSRSSRLGRLLRVRRRVTTRGRRVATRARRR